MWRVVRGVVVLQEGTVGEQWLCVPVAAGHRWHQLQAEVAFHRLIEAPIPNAQAAVVVHLGWPNKRIQIQEN